MIDPKFYWERKPRLDWTALQAFVEPDGPLWLNNQSSTHGLNDRVAIDRVVTLKSSLRLIHVDRLTVRVFRPGLAFNDPKRRVQAQFMHQGTQHRLWITDPIFERRYLAKPDGEYRMGECCLTISLGDPFDGFAYKLVAAMIPRERSGVR